MMMMMMMRMMMMMMMATTMTTLFVRWSKITKEVGTRIWQKSEHSYNFQELVKFQLPFRTNFHLHNIKKHMKQINKMY